MNENNPNLPKSSLRFLKWFCPAHLYEEIEGDLIQKFHRDVNVYGERKAKRRLTWNVIRFFRPGILMRNMISMDLIQFTILQNYFKITIRNLLKRKAYSLINVFGLAIGMSACLVIAKYVEFETSFESSHTNAKNIYRVVSSFYTDGKTESFCGYDLGPNILNDFPEFRRFSRIHHNGSVVTIDDDSQNHRKFKESVMLIADSTFLDMFTFKFIQGNSRTALANPNSVVITQSIALKYFGASANPIGKIVTLEDGWIPGSYEVSAVVEDVPANSHFKFDLLLPMQALLQIDFYRNDNSRWDNFHTYLESNPSSDMFQLNERIPAFVKKYQGSDKSIKSKSNLQFQPLLDIHYSPDLENPGSHWKMIYFFAVLAIFILLIAWVNYINLSTARAMERAREVGVKKVLGVFRGQLIFQFVFESAIINLISISLALILARMTLPMLNQLIEQSLVFNFLDPALWIIIAVLFLAGTFGAGIYPALLLSSYKASEVIKGKIVKKAKGFSLRNNLVTFQFSASLMLLIATYAIYKQVAFMKDQEKSLDTSQIIIVKGPELSERKDIEERVFSFKNEIRQLSFVDNICTSFSLPGEDASVSSGMRKEGSPVEENRIGNIYWVDPDFIDLYNIPLIEGKAWNPQVNSEMESVVINEEAVKVFNLGTNKDALKGKIITPFGTHSVIGVVKNHHWNSLKQPFAPMIFHAEKISATSISIKLNGDIRNNIDLIKSAYNNSFPDDTFSYYFMDDTFNAQYKEEARIGQLFSIFSVLAVTIGCLGLWGLASFATLHRLKEISIRKVLGATVNSIVMLLTRQFLRPIMVSSLIAFPVIWWGVNKWMEQFPYRMKLSFDLFLIPLFLLLVTAMCTIGFQTLRAATSNPVNSLKNE
ncbi:MAG: ABC transporter permease [Cyclobacteriaceae bacterium]|nr:ABC transporter permease [Cyclobacteriaceae bacterium]